MRVRASGRAARGIGVEGIFNLLVLGRRRGCSTRSETRQLSFFELDRRERTQEREEGAGRTRLLGLGLAHGELRCECWLRLVEVKLRLLSGVERRGEGGTRAGGSVSMVGLRVRASDVPDELNML